MDPISLAVLGSLAAAAAGGYAETFLRRLFRRQESGRDHRARDTVVLLDRDTQHLQEGLASLESDIQASHLREAELERVSEDVRVMARILDEHTNVLKERLREQERRSNEAAAKQERRSFWMDFVSNGFFFFLGLAVSAFTGFGGG
jgi:hypothetical protein